MARGIRLPFVLAGLLTVVAGSQWLPGATVRFVAPRDRLDAELRADAADGTWDGLTLVEAALVAEGIQSIPERRNLSDKFIEWKRELGGRVARTEGTSHRALAVLDFLHERILTGRYVAECHELSRTLRGGDFNCITATIAYLELGRSIGLPLTAIQAPGHVHVRLSGEVAFDIEPTSPSRGRISAEPSSGPRAGFFKSSAVAIEPIRPVEPCRKLPPLVSTAGTINEGRAGSTEFGGTTKCRSLSDVALVGKICYNEGIRLLEEKRFQQSVAATRMALALDPDDAAARNNLLAAFNNWALDLCERRRYSDAAALIVLAREIDPDFGPLVSNDLHVHQKWVLDLCEQRRFAEALDILEQGHRRRPEADLFDEGRSAVRRWWAESHQPVNFRAVEMD